MLVIIVGDGGSGKTYFRNNLMSRIPGYNPNLKTDVKLEPNVGDVFDPTPHNTIIETRNHSNCHRNDSIVGRTLLYLLVRMHSIRGF